MNIWNREYKTSNFIYKSYDMYRKENKITMKDQVIKKWKYTLTRSDCISFWIVTDSLNFSVEEDWLTHNRFVMPPPKLKNYGKDNNVLDWRNYYTPEELEEILNEEIWNQL